MGIKLPGWQPREWVAPLETSTKSYHVIVVGGGLSGCAAAIAAGRRGCRVVLLEPTHMLGGQMTVGGVGTIDLVPNFQSTVEQGLWGEIARRIRTVYAGYNLTTSVARYRLYDSMAVNAPVADRVLTEMCHDAGVEIVRNCAVISGYVSTTSASATTPVGTFTGSVAIDATEDGSFLAQANFPFRAGTQKGRGTSLPGEPSVIQSITQCAVLRRYDDGIPAHLRLTTPPPGYETYKPAIESYFPYKRNYNEGTVPSTNDFAGFRAYPDIADLVYYDGLDRTEIRRTSVNSSNDVAIDTTFLTDIEAKRAATTIGINKTLSIIYFLQHEYSLNWAVAQDEGFNQGPEPRTLGVTDGMPSWVADFPNITYQRESRRLIGKYTLTADRIRRPAAGIPSKWSTENVAIGTYGTDIHGTVNPEDFEADLGESADDFRFSAVGPFVIPFGSFVPQDNRRLVVAEKNLSMSRVASSAVRVHPSVTAVGEAAGVIAALAWKQGVAPRAVSPRAVQISLLKRGALLLPYPIRGVSASHPDYLPIALAVLHNRVKYTLDNNNNLVSLAYSQITAAKEIGRNLVKYWSGPL